MTIRSITEFLDNLYTTTWYMQRDGVADNIFTGTPFWFWLKEHGGFDTAEGGRKIKVNLRYAKSENLKWIGKGGTVNLQDQEHLTSAFYDWRYFTDSIVRYFTDDQQNRGKAAAINLVDSKIEMSKDSQIDELEERLFGTEADGLATGELYMLGLRDIVPDDPTTSASELAGIDPSVHTWWRSKSINMNSVSFATNGIDRMRTMYNNCMQNLRMDAPDIIVTGQTPYEMYEAEVEEQKRIVNKTLGDAGFENIEFKGVPIVWSPKGKSNNVDRMYFLNTKFLKFIYDPYAYFDMTEWKPIPNSFDRAAQIITACQLVTQRRMCHGVIYNINTP